MPAKHPEGPIRGRPFQYSLRAMLALTAVVALVSGLLFAAPPVVRSCTGLAVILLLPMLCTVLLVYCPGFLRTFAIGALFSSGILFVRFGFQTIDHSMVVISLVESSGFGALTEWLSEMDKFHSVGAVAMLGLGLLFGLVAVGARWLVEPRT